MENAEDDGSIAIDDRSENERDEIPGEVELLVDVPNEEGEHIEKRDEVNPENTNSEQATELQPTRRNPAQEIRAPQWFTISTLKRVYSEDEPTAHQAMTGKNQIKLK